MSTETRPMLTVTAALIRVDGRILLTRRGPEQKMAAKWEFPGGTIETGETPAQCLQRELGEELGIRAVIGEQLAESEHSYPFAVIRLILLEVLSFTGEIHLRVHDRLAWVEPGNLPAYDLAPADIPLVEAILSRPA